jgi:chromosome segregation ATPase
MALTDKFRINELAQKGSKVERRTTSGKILVQKLDGKEIRPKNIEEQKPFGDVVIKAKNQNPKFKSELNEVDITPNIEQTSFSGESTGYVEKPKYNEEELKKAVDVKVDELIKKKKPKRGPYILKSKYDDLRKKYEDALAQIADLRKQLNTALAEIERLNGVVEQLKVEVDSAKLQQAAAENQLQAANNRYITLLSDFQQAII